MIKDIKRGRYSVNGVRKTYTKVETDFPRILKVILRVLGVQSVIEEGSLFVVNM